MWHFGGKRSCAILVASIHVPFWWQAFMCHFGGKRSCAILVASVHVRSLDTWSGFEAATQLKF